MAIALLARGQGNSTFSSGPTPTSHTINKPAEAVAGTFVMVRIAMAIPGTGVSGPITSVPAGWTLATVTAEGWRSGTPSSRYACYKKVMAADEPASWTWQYAVASNVVSQYEVYSGVDTTTPITHGGCLVGSVGRTTRPTPSIITDGSRYITYDTNDRNGSTPVPPSPDGATALRSAQSGDVQLTSAYMGVQAAGTYQRTFTGAASTSNFAASIYALQETTTPTPPGLAVSMWNGTQEVTAYMTVWGGTNEIDVTGLEVVEPPAEGFVIADLLSDKPFYVAHRGGSKNWPEMTLYAYEQATQVYDYKAIEVSVYKTSDGVWACLHDWTTQRTTGQYYEVWETPWTPTIEDLIVLPVGTSNQSQPGRPFARLDQVLDAYINSHVIFLDCKETDDSEELYDWMETNYPGLNKFDRIVMKFFKAGYAQAESAKLLGYTTWGCYFTNEAITEPTRISSFDWVGIEYNSTSTQRANLVSSGKPIIAHTPASITAKNSALAWGADGMMVAAPISVGPNNQ